MFSHFLSGRYIYISVRLLHRHVLHLVLFSHVVKLLVTRLFPIERIGPLLHPCDVEALIHVTSELPLAKRTSWLHSLNWHLASYGSLLFTVFIKMKFGVKIYRIKCQA